jgi:hypothetical protein
MRVRAWEWGLGLGLIISMAIMVTPTGVDDFSQVFWPAGRAGDPYASGLYFYPVWNTWVLRVLALFPREVGLGLIWSCNVVYVITFALVWDTPPWMALLAPPFLTAMLFGHPFEALVLIGVSLLWLGWRWDRAWLLGLGLVFCLFKPQLGFLPALVGAYTLASSRRRGWSGWAIPMGFVCLATLLEWAVYDGLWWGPWWRAMRQAPEVTAAWNASFVQGFHLFSVLWLPIGLWLLSKVEDLRRRLWVAMALGLLISPYWAGYSLYPLVAMAGCWARREG